MDNNKSKPLVIKNRVNKDAKAYNWWKATNPNDLVQQVVSCADFIKQNQQQFFKQLAMLARLYGNKPTNNYLGSSMSRMDNGPQLPSDRVTFNIIQSNIDTIVSGITSSRPSPTFITNAGDYKQRKLAKQLTEFVGGVFYDNDVYEKATMVLRDALILGTGIIKVYEDIDHKVCVERVIASDMLIDNSDGVHGEPRQLFQLKLVDRSVLEEMAGAKIATAATAAQEDLHEQHTVADQVILIEAWHLPSSKTAKDGRHVIICDSGVILDEPYEKSTFPFIFLHYSKKLLGFWSQGLAEQLQGLQIEINKLLSVVTQAIQLVGVPRVFIEAGSKVNKASFNNNIGTIIEYTGNPPVVNVSPAMPQEVYNQIENLINKSYIQAGTSQLQAAGVKPAGLDSGEAIRTYDQISDNRMGVVARRYDKLFISLAEKIVDLAKDIVKETGSYSTIYPAKETVREIDLSAVDELDIPFIVQVFNEASLPKDPAGKLQKVTEMVQSGMLSLQEGRRLLNFPDLNQMEKLDLSGEERIFQILDKIVEDGVYTPPDPFLPLDLASELSVKYINLYLTCNLDDDKIELLRTFNSQVSALIQEAQAAQQAAAAQALQQQQENQLGMQAASAHIQANAQAQAHAAPEPMPTSPLIKNGAIK